MTVDVNEYLKLYHEGKYDIEISRLKQWPLTSVSRLRKRLGLPAKKRLYGRTTEDQLPKNKIQEIKVLSLKGLSDREIGRRLKCSRGIVHYYRVRLRLPSTYKLNTQWTKKEDAVVLNMLLENKTYAEIGRQLGRTRAEVTNRIGRLGYTGISNVRRKVTTEQIVELVGRLTQAEIARKLKITTETVRYHLRKGGIRAKDDSDAIASRKPLRERCGMPGRFEETRD